MKWKGRPRKSAKSASKSVCVNADPFCGTIAPDDRRGGGSIAKVNTVMCLRRDPDVRDRRGRRVKDGPPKGVHNKNPLKGT